MKQALEKKLERATRRSLPPTVQTELTDVAERNSKYAAAIKNIQQDAEAKIEHVQQEAAEKMRRAMQNTKEALRRRDIRIDEVKQNTEQQRRLGLGFPGQNTECINHQRS